MTLFTWLRRKYPYRMNCEYGCHVICLDPRKCPGPDGRWGQCQSLRKDFVIKTLNYNQVFDMATSKFVPAFNNVSVVVRECPTCCYRESVHDPIKRDLRPTLGGKFLSGPNYRLVCRV